VIITAAHYKAARQLLGWSQSRLAGEAGVSATTVGYIEGGVRLVPAPTISKIRRVLEDAGVEFASGEPRVKLRKAK
jgi:transcriptional regulator with XRE-family HTH domain